MTLVKVIGNPISDGIVFKDEHTHLPLLEAWEGWKVSSYSGTLDDLQKQYLDWYAWAIIVFDVFFFSVSWSQVYGLFGLSLYTSNDLTYNSIRFKKPWEIFFDSKFKEKVPKNIELWFWL